MEFMMIDNNKLIYRVSHTAVLEYYGGGLFWTAKCCFQDIIF